VSVRLTSDLHDALARESMRRGVDMSEVIRERLAFRNPKRPRGTFPGTL
jgi:hypothetical protein